MGVFSRQDDKPRRLNRWLAVVNPFRKIFPRGDCPQRSTRQPAFRLVIRPAMNFQGAHGQRWQLGQK